MHPNSKCLGFNRKQLVITCGCVLWFLLVHVCWYSTPSRATFVGTCHERWESKYLIELFLWLYFTGISGTFPESHCHWNVLGMLQWQWFSECVLVTMTFRVCSNDNDFLGMFQWHCLLEYVPGTMTFWLCSSDTDFLGMFQWHWLSWYVPVTLTSRVCSNDTPPVTSSFWHR